MTAAVDRTGPATTRARTAAYCWIALSALAIALLAPLPYLTSSLQDLTRADEPLAANYVDRPVWVQAVFYLHIVFGGLVLLLSPAQFAARLRRRAPRLHRTVGRVALVSIVVAGVAGTLLAPFSLAGPVGTAGFGTLAVLWLTFAAAAYRAIRRGDVRAHRRWAIRTFALTYAAVTLRLWIGVLVVSQMALSGVSEDLAFDRAYVIVPFLCWVPNLLIAQVFLSRSGVGTADGAARGVGRFTS